MSPFPAPPPPPPPRSAPGSLMRTQTHTHAHTRRGGRARRAHTRAPPPPRPRGGRLPEWEAGRGRSPLPGRGGGPRGHAEPGGTTPASRRGRQAGRQAAPAQVSRPPGRGLPRRRSGLEDRTAPPRSPLPAPLGRDTRPPPHPPRGAATESDLGVLPGSGGGRDPPSGNAAAPLPALRPRQPPPPPRRRPSLGRGPEPPGLGTEEASAPGPRPRPNSEGRLARGPLSACRAHLARSPKEASRPLHPGEGGRCGQAGMPVFQGKAGPKPVRPTSSRGGPALWGPRPSAASRRPAAEPGFLWAISQWAEQGSLTWGSRWRGCARGHPLRRAPQALFWGRGVGRGAPWECPPPHGPPPLLKPALFQGACQGQDLRWEPLRSNLPVARKDTQWLWARHTSKQNLPGRVVVFRKGE